MKLSDRNAQEHEMTAYTTYLLCFKEGSSSPSPRSPRKSQKASPKVKVKVGDQMEPKTKSMLMEGEDKRSKSKALW